MKNNRNIRKGIKSCYIKFFKEFDVDSKSGVYKKDKKFKFATYPYIGNQYGKNTKILFIGLNMGKDEDPGCIKSFDKRQEDIGSEKNYKEKRKYNLHIAGTLITAAYFNDKSKILGKIKNAKNYTEAIRILYKTNTKNPLSYIALTNFYKFVTKGMSKRTGYGDREHISSEYRQELLCDEIKILQPQIIIFQSLEFWHPEYKDFLKILKIQNKKVKIYIGPHPACRGRCSRIPNKYLKLINKIK